MSIRKAKKIYLKFYARASALLKEANPCCIASKSRCFGYQDKEGLCCEGCKHLGPKGCTVKSLACKFWLCFPLQVKKQGLAKQLWNLQKEAKELGIPMGFRMSMGENFKFYSQQRRETRKWRSRWNRKKNLQMRPSA